MEQVIYGDVLFAVNFSMDFLSLYVAGRITHERMRPLPLAAGATIGGLYGVAALFAGLSGLFGWLINAATALLICFTAYERARFAVLIRRTALFYGISFLLGGAMTALYNFLNVRIGEKRVVADGEEARLVGKLPFYLLAALAAGSAASALVIGRILRKRRTRTPSVIEITVGCRTVRLSALCDSGDLASEPLGGLPVIFVSRGKLRGLFTGAEADALLAGDQTGISRLPRETAKRVRVVPLSTVAGRRTGIGFIPDRLTVNGEEKRACIVADEGPFGDEDALIPEILT